MNQPPSDIVTPDELIDFIKKQNVSEEAATGIKLLRRAAETIAWLNSEPRHDVESSEKFQAHHIENILGALDLMQGYAFFGPDTLTEQAVQKIEALSQPPENFEIQQVALALGLENDSLEEILDKIETFGTERDHHITAIEQRDDVIRQADQELQRLQNTPRLATPPSSLGVDVTTQQAMQEAIKFGYALIGLSVQDGLPQWVVHGAQEIIEYGQNN